MLKGWLIQVALKALLSDPTTLNGVLEKALVWVLGQAEKTESKFDDWAVQQLRAILMDEATWERFYAAMREWLLVQRVGLVCGAPADLNAVMDAVKSEAEVGGWLEFLPLVQMLLKFVWERFVEKDVSPDHGDTNV